MATILGIWHHCRIREAVAEVREVPKGYEVQFAPDDIQQCRSDLSVQRLMSREGFIAPGECCPSIANHTETTVLAPAEVLQLDTQPVRSIEDIMRQLDFGPQEFA